MFLLMSILLVVLGILVLSGVFLLFRYIILPILLVVLIALGIKKLSGTPTRSVHPAQTNRPRKNVGPTDSDKWSDF